VPPRFALADGLRTINVGPSYTRASEAGPAATSRTRFRMASLTPPVSQSA